MFRYKTTFQQDNSLPFTYKQICLYDWLFKHLLYSLIKSVLLLLSYIKNAFTRNVIFLLNCHHVELPRDNNNNTVTRLLISLRDSK